MRNVLWMILAQGLAVPAAFAQEAGAAAPQLTMGQRLMAMAPMFAIVFFIFYFPVPK